MFSWLEHIKQVGYQIKGNHWKHMCISRHRKIQE